MKKSTLIMMVSIVLAIALGVGGTLAYLVDQDADVNTMTLGNVKIDQQEWQRVTDEDGNFVTDKDGYVLERFDDEGLVLVPSVGEVTGWDPTVVPFDQIGGEGNMQMLDGKENVVDKLVVVKNMGNSDTYVRTLIAYELGDCTYERWNEIFMTSKHNFWSATDLGVVEISGNQYVVVEYVYDRVLKPEEVSRNSLAQVYLKPEATNEDVAALDGNGNGTYDILVISQAVQAAGFDDGKTALEAGFGESTPALASEWFGDLYSEDGIVNEEMVYSPEPVEKNEEVVIDDHWDGTVDTRWYNDTDTEFVIETAEQLAGLAKLVDEGNTFEDKTVKLGANVCLSCDEENGCAAKEQHFNPIGHSSNGKMFKGTFDGQNNVIKNMYMQSNLDDTNGGWLYEGEYYALFAYTDGATIKNLTMDGAYISSGRNEGACIAGNAVNTNFEGINIKNAEIIIYNNSGAGVVSECYGTCNFTDINVDADTVVGPLWGTYDSRNGGVVGMVRVGNTVNFKNVNVACRIDAINDVAANYQYWLYRYSGMLIGEVSSANGVADPTGYVTCENVTVTYDDWMNYHYCEFESLGQGSYNAPDEFKYARVEAGTGTGGIDLNACEHSEDESHNVLIVFNQLFGGGQGVKGLASYEGVTVNYPESYNPEN